VPGVTTAKMLEQMMEGYEKSFEPDFNEESDVPRPEPIRLVPKQAAAASWKTLAKERITDAHPKRFWPNSKDETREIEDLLKTRKCAGLRQCFGRGRMTRALGFWMPPTGSRDAAHSVGCDTPSSSGSVVIRVKTLISASRISKRQRKRRLPMLRG
jgi:hypothetical protein